MDRKTFDRLNRIYKPLWEKAVALRQGLKDAGYAASIGFFNNHSIKLGGEFVIEYFPIPVITLEGIGDVGVDLDAICLEVVLSKEKALCLDYRRLAESYRFEVYGVEDYLTDIYNAQIDLADIAANIESSGEARLCVCFHFDFDVEIEGILAAIRALVL